MVPQEVVQKLTLEVVQKLTLEVVQKLTLERPKRGTETHSNTYIYREREKERLREFLWRADKVTILCASVVSTHALTRSSAGERRR